MKVETENRARPAPSAPSVDLGPDPRNVRSVGSTTYQARRVFRLVNFEERSAYAPSKGERGAWEAGTPSWWNDPDVYTVAEVKGLGLTGVRVVCPRPIERVVGAIESGDQVIEMSETVATTGQVLTWGQAVEFGVVPS